MWICALRPMIHDRFTVTHAIRIGHVLEELQVMLLETPVHSSDIAATIEVAKAIAPVPVAVGERYCATGGVESGCIQYQASLWYY